MNVRMKSFVSSNDWKFGRRKLPMIGKNLRALASTAVLVCAATWAYGIGVSSNLMVNGSFEDGLKGWRYQYNQHGGESWYADNDKMVSIVDRMDGKVSVLAIKPTYSKTWLEGGVKVDSAPIPIDSTGGAKYRLTVTAKSTGPNCRILLEGYKWRPGIKPHDNPDWTELRREYKFAQVYFTGSGKGGAVKVETKSKGTLTGKPQAGPGGEDAAGSGDFGGVKKMWSTGSTTFPDEHMTELAKGMYEQCKFVCLHVVGIGMIIGVDEYKKRDDCYLYVDDIKLERIK